MNTFLILGEFEFPDCYCFLKFCSLVLHFVAHVFSVTQSDHSAE